MHRVTTLHTVHNKSKQDGTWRKQSFNTVIGQSTSNKSQVMDSRRQEKWIWYIENGMQSARVVLDHDISYVLQ